MDDQGTEPPDKHKPNVVLAPNESILCEMELKQELIVKQESEEEDDMETVSTTRHTFNESLDASTDDEQADDTKDFAGFCGLVDVKPKVKAEKVEEGLSQNGHKSSDQSGSPPNTTSQGSSNGKIQNGSNDKAQNKTVQSQKKNKANIFGRKKNSSVEKTNRKRHKCLLCNYVTDKKSNSKHHMFTHTDEKPFPCNVCPKRFTRKQLLQSHMKKHIDQFLFSCSICFQGFDHNEEKVEHEAGCKIRRYECYLCKEFSTSFKADLENHMRVHTGERPFQCDHCSMKFNRASNLGFHRRTHSKPRPMKFKCSVCFKNFKQQMEMKNHEADCKLRGYKCNLCKIYTTNHKTDLVNHIRIHTGEKPFQCEICSKRFSNNSNLNRHKKIHK